MGVTTKKKIIPMTIGATIAPSANPSLYHNLFRGLKSFEFNIPKIKKIIETIIDQVLIEPSLINGHKAIQRNKIKKTKPKLLFELIFTLVLYIISWQKYILKVKIFNEKDNFLQCNFSYFFIFTN